MRKVNTGDVFKMARLLKNGDMISVIKKAYEAGREEGADSERIGINVILGILSNCTDAKIEMQIYDLISGICEKKQEDIKDQSLETTIEDIKKIVKENNIINFLNSASGLAEKI